MKVTICIEVDEETGDWEVTTEGGSKEGWVSSGNCLEDVLDNAQCGLKYELMDCGLLVEEPNPGEYVWKDDL